MAEAELKFYVLGLCDAFGGAMLCKEWGMPGGVESLRDSSAAGSIALIVGSGEWKHFQEQWAQATVRCGRIARSRVPRLLDAADALSDSCRQATLRDHVLRGRLLGRPGRSSQGHKGAGGGGAWQVNRLFVQSCTERAAHFMGGRVR